MCLDKAFIGVVLAIALIGLMSNCSDLLEVELPGVVEVGTLDDPGLASLLMESAISDFECAYTNYTAGSSAQSDEWWHTSGGQVYREWGGRQINAQNENYVRAACDAGGFGQYVVIHTARFQAKDAFERIDGFDDADVPGDKAVLLATVSAYEAYSLLMLGENFCEMAIDEGPLMQPAEVLALAEERFERAITMATGTDEIRNMASVGLARARRGMGDLIGAAAAAASVPVDFLYVVNRDDTPQRRWNRMFDSGVRRSDYSVAPPFRDVEWKGDPDPRVELFFNGVIAAYGIDWWQSTKYQSLSDPIPLATWVEAQLIIAEAEGGQTAVDIINQLHARAGLQPFDPAIDIVDGPTADNIINMVIEQRRRELFLEGGHRLSDMLMYDLPFFTGVDHLGREYGTTTCWPLPELETLGNPNIS
jgi:hypothetical protein